MGVEGRHVIKFYTPLRTSSQVGQKDYMKRGGGGNQWPKENFFPGGSVSKESLCNEGDPCSIPGPGEIPWIRTWQSTPVFFPGESHGQSSLVGHVGTHRPFGRQERDTTEQLTHTHTSRTSGKGK